MHRWTAVRGFDAGTRPGRDEHNVPAEKVTGTRLGNLHKQPEGSKSHPDRLHNDIWEVEVNGTVKLRTLGTEHPQIRMEVRPRNAVHETKVQGVVEIKNRGGEGTADKLGRAEIGRDAK